MPTPLGNILESSTESTLNSPTAKDIRRSVSDGSYKYCDLVKCSYIETGTVPLKTDVLALHAQPDNAAHLAGLVAAADWRALPAVAPRAA